MDLGTPVGTEAICDFAERDGRPDFAFRDIVGRWDITVGDEEAELAPPGLDLLEQNLARRMCNRYSRAKT
jgi:hypothetical protein